MTKDNAMIFNTTHLLADDEQELEIEVEDVGRCEIRICFRPTLGEHEVSHKQWITLSLGEKHALRLCHLIETYFQDKNMPEAGNGKQDRGSKTS